MRYVRPLFALLLCAGALGGLILLPRTRPEWYFDPITLLLLVAGTVWFSCFGFRGEELKAWWKAVHAPASASDSSVRDAIRVTESARRVCLTMGAGMVAAGAITMSHNSSDPDSLLMGATVAVIPLIYAGVLAEVLLELVRLRILRGKGSSFRPRRGGLIEAFLALAVLGVLVLLVVVP